MSDGMDLRPWNVLELCAGAGGLGLGIKLAVPGARGIAYVEREASAAATLVTRMEAGDLAPAPIWSDLATFDPRPWRGRVHCVASGDPCQPNSVAGKGLGEDDERFLADQVLRVVDGCRPLRLFRENVTGNAAGQLAALVPALERMGYRVEAGIFSSAATGNNHGRERLVLMADRADCPGWLYPRPWRTGEGATDIGGVGERLDDAQRAEWRPFAGEGRAARSHDGATGREQGAAGARASGEELGCCDHSPGAGLAVSGSDGCKPGRRGSPANDGRCSGSRREERHQPMSRSRALAHSCSQGRRSRRVTEPQAEGGEAFTAVGDADLAGAVSVADAGGFGDTAGLSATAGGGREPPKPAKPHHDRGGLPVICPGPADPAWAAILAADPLVGPAIGKLDLFVVARRNLGLPPLVDAIGRRGGMVRDLDAQTAEAVVAEVRRMADAMADRVERLRQLGNGVDPVVGWDAWVHLDARHRARREREQAGQSVLGPAA